MDKEIWHSLLHRAAETNKYDYGHVLVIGGSEALVGAPVLAARSALRTGAGLVTIASTADVVALIDRDIEEVMTLSLPNWDQTKQLVAALKSFAADRHVSVIIMGPGLPAAADEAIRALLEHIHLPMVLDAECFTALSGNLPALQAAATSNSSLVLTPHSGEYARLLQGQDSLGNASETDSAAQFTRYYHVTLVLKRHHTLVAGADGAVHQNTTGNPGLATAGAGDVLTGIIAGLLAQNIEPFTAARMAVQLHGLAADAAAQSKTEPGLIASDVIESIPAALHMLDR